MSIICFMFYFNIVPRMEEYHQTSCCLKHRKTITIHCRVFETSTAGNRRVGENTKWCLDVDFRSQCMYIYIYIFMYTCVLIISLDVYMYIITHCLCVHIHIYIYIYTRMCVYIYTYNSVTIIVMIIYVYTQ